MLHNEKGCFKVSVFHEFSASVSGAFILAGGLGAGVSFMGFRHFPDIS